MKTLRDVKIGETVKVVKLHGEGPVKRRIMDMGITKGVEIYVRKVAPLGDPMELTVRGYELSRAQGRHRDDRGGLSNQFFSCSRGKTFGRSVYGMADQNCTGGQPELR